MTLVRLQLHSAPIGSSSTPFTTQETSTLFSTCVEWFGPEFTLQLHSRPPVHVAPATLFGSIQFQSPRGSSLSHQTWCGIIVFRAAKWKILDKAEAKNNHRWVRPVQFSSVSLLADSHQFSSVSLLVGPRQFSSVQSSSVQSVYWYTGRVTIE